MNRSIAIATTTIFPLDFLEAYADNLLRHERAGEVKIYVAGDRKSPAGCEEAAEACRRRGVDARFLSIDWQNDYLARFPDLAAIVPENSDNRRNVAYLLALEEGADVVISIDDDNYCIPEEDFVGGHLAVGTTVDAPEAIGDGNWFNLCSMLDSKPAGGRLYPRGFPYGRRGTTAAETGAQVAGHVGVNAGLWLLDPDTDAIGRLHDRPEVTGWSGESVLLRPGVRSPINTQNTSLTRAAMGAYYYVRMGVQLRGLTLDRFGDILSGYFVQVCADAVGDRVRIGSPVVEHRRHAHDLLVDLYHELAGVMVLEDLAGFLESIAIEADNYLDAYRTLSRELEAFCAGQQGFIWTEETRSYFADVARYMRIWADVVSSLD